MFRDFLTMFLAVAFAVFAIAPPLGAQDGAAPPPGQPYPQQQYPQPQPPQAQQQPYAQQDSEAPDAAADRQHGVARISVVQGDVNVRRGDSGELVAAAMNAPLVAQDRLQTSQGSRAEVELDSANLIRLAPNTDVGFADLEYHRYQVQLGAGTILFRVLRNSNAQTEIDTPSIAVKPATLGEYRISALDDGTTQITVRSGEAEIFSPRGSQRLEAQHTILVRGNPSDPEFQDTYELARDQFDDWSATRDHELLASQSYRYVSPDIYGADDLDTYGNWVPSQYGNVWEPRAPGADWAPYSNGEWVSEPYYGWTWVDSAPWGWAPYHYGRWFNNPGYGWCWWPGARFSSYLWSPALVGFFGWGGGIGIGLGGLGWVALAPFEIFHGWWGHGWRGGYGYGRGGYGFGGYGRGNIASMYRNAAFRGGAITASRNGFGGPNQRFGRATAAQLSNASLVRGQLPVSPTRGSYQFSNRQATQNPRLASAANRQFFQHQQPGYRGGFSSAQRGLAPSSRLGSQVGSQPGAHGVAPNMQGAYAARNGYASAPRTSSGGWQRFGDPGTASRMRQGFTGNQESSGWHRFGQPQPPVGPSVRERSQPQASYGRSFGTGNYGGNYQSRPLGANPAAPQQRPGFSSGYRGGYNGGFSGGRPAYSAPHYSAPAMPRYSAPAAPHYSAPSPSFRGGGGSSFHGGGGGAPRGGGGGGSSHGGGGGGHSSSGGHRGR